MSVYERYKFETLGRYLDLPWADSTSSNWTYYVKKDRILGSQGHYGYPNFNIWDAGGDFMLESTERSPFVMNVGGIRGTGPYWPATYTGRVVAYNPLPGPFGALAGPAAWGAEAYSKMKPAKPEFSALNAIYELRELPGALKQKMESGPLRNTSRYHLALQFGWKPLLSDIRKMYLLYLDIDKKYAQLLRDNGKPVRRRLILRNAVEESDITTGDHWGWHQPSFVNYFYDGAPTYSQKTVTTDQVWASARFRYWLPPAYTDPKYASKVKAQLFGVTFPSPSQIYNAIPWSWLIDYFTNLGSVIENLDTGIAERLAADYFYVMRKYKVETVTTVDYRFYNSADYAVKRFTGPSTSNRALLMRTRGDPFGIATNQNDLSAMQLSILGALGLSRIR